MAKQNEIQTPTLADYLINQLDKPVAVKGGGFLKDPVDGHEMTTMEAIGMKMLQNALNGDIKAAQFIMQLEANNRLKQRNKK